MGRTNHKNTIQGEADRQRIFGVLSVEPVTATRVGQVLSMSYVMAYTHLTTMRLSVPKQAYVWGWKKIRGHWRAIYGAGDYSDVPHPDELREAAQLVEIPQFIRRKPGSGRPARKVAEAQDASEQNENSTRAAQMVEAATARPNSWLGALGL